MLRKLMHSTMYPFRVVKGSQKIPIGRTYYGKTVLLDIGRMPHTKIAGLTGMGKTNIILTILYFLCNQFTANELELHIIDLKGASYSQWSNVPHVKGIHITTEQAMTVLENSVSVMRERLAKINEARAAFKPVPWFPLYVILIDEGGELTPSDAVGEEEKMRKRCMSALSTLVRIGREPMFRIFYGTQRPDATTLPMTVRGQLDNTICFRVRERGDSRVVLGNEKGVDLMVNPGRAIYQSGVQEVEFQAIYIPENSLTRWLKSFVDKVETVG